MTRISFSMSIFLISHDWNLHSYFIFLFLGSLSKYIYTYGINIEFSIHLMKLRSVTLIGCHIDEIPAYIYYLFFQTGERNTCLFIIPLFCKEIHILGISESNLGFPTSNSKYISLRAMLIHLVKIFLQ